MRSARRTRLSGSLPSKMRGLALQLRKAALLRKTGMTRCGCRRVSRVARSCSPPPPSRTLRASSASGVNLSTSPARTAVGSRSRWRSGVKPIASGTSCLKRRDPAHKSAGAHRPRSPARCRVSSSSASPRYVPVEKAASTNSFAGTTNPLVALVLIDASLVLNLLTG